MTTVALADDHTLIRTALASLVEVFGYKVLFEVSDGQECMEKISSGLVPDILLLDIKMPRKDGHETAAWLKEHHPDIKIVVLTMCDDETAILRMVNTGINAYVVKGDSPSELRQALQDVQAHGYRDALFEKFNAKNRIELVMRAQEMGYL